MGGQGMKIDLTPEEAHNLRAAINAAIKASDDAVEVASVLLPIVAKIQAASKPKGRNNG